MTNQELQEQVIDYLNYSSDRTEMVLDDSLMILANQLIDNDKYGTHYTPRQLTDYCMERIERFDPAKGKAFAFFTTIMMCLIRQSFRVERYRDQYVNDVKRRKVIEKARENHNKD